MRKIQARWYQAGRTRPIRLVVIHDMEAPEAGTTAESVAAYFAGLPATRKASAHVCVDNNSAVRCVEDRDTAYAAPGANHDGLHLEMAGYARQTREQWLDPYGQAMFAIAAQVVADWCDAYQIPPVRLSVADILAGKKGLCGHVDVTNAYHQSTHTDPGPHFPWEEFLARVWLAGHPSVAAPAPRRPIVSTLLYAHRATPDYDAASWYVHAHGGQLAVTANLAAAKAALGAGATVYAIGGPACADLPTAHPVNGKTALDTGRLLAAMHL